jgi:hypothetical protein
MGEVVSFPSARRETSYVRQRPPATVYEGRGWRILEFPSAGQYLALSDYCRRGIEVGRFNPEADSDNHHEGTDIAILTKCAADERLSRCAIGWLNSGGPEAAILGSFVVAYGGRYHFWRDAVVEVAVIGGLRLVRLLDGAIALAREPEPVPLLDPFAALPEHRRRRAFDLLPGEARAAVLRWADPRDQFANRLDPPKRPH